MELTLRVLADTRAAFDAVAPRYDADNAANPIICRMRARTMALVRARVAAGSALLDLGCGPGVDAVHLAHAGYSLTAIDWSPEMARQAGQRVLAEGLECRVRVRTLGIHQLDALAPASFDAAYSNLGPLNCVPDLREAGEAIASRLRTGGRLIASVIGRYCPWEIVRYGAAGDWQRLAVRFSRTSMPVPLDRRTVWTTYYTPREFAAAFTRSGFRVASVAALGLLLPPPYLENFARRHPGLVRRLDELDVRVGRLPGLRQWGDHFLIELVKC